MDNMRNWGQEQQKNAYVSAGKAVGAEIFKEGKNFFSDLTGNNSTNTNSSSNRSYRPPNNQRPQQSQWTDE